MKAFTPTKQPEYMKIVGYSVRVLNVYAFFEDFIY